jgi:hypothetical protein
MEIKLLQAMALVAVFGGDKKSSMTVVAGDGHSGKGLYACSTDYPEEGSVFLGPSE